MKKAITDADAVVEAGELMPVSSLEEDREAVLDALNEEKNDIICSFVPEGVEGQKGLFKALNTQKTVKEKLNCILKLRDVVIEPVTLTDKVTGAPRVAPRICLITVEGDSFISTSWGLLNSIKKINAIFGTLHFPDGLEVIPQEIKTNKGFTLTLTLAD